MGLGEFVDKGIQETEAGIVVRDQEKVCEVTHAVAPKKERIRIFDAEMYPITMDETVDWVCSAVENRQMIQHVVVNVAKLVMMRKDREVRDIINSCEIINVDGRGVIVGAKFLGYDIPERVTGIDLFLRLITVAAETGFRVYFLGAKEEVIQEVVRRFRGRYPSLEIAGYRNGYFSREEEPWIAKDIRDSKADLLFVAMSSPEKERFIRRHKNAMRVPFSMGVGGSFDVVAGKTKRAPLWMQNAGLEWFFRLLCEPKRMWKRYLTSNATFLWMLLKARLFGKERYGCS